MRPVWLLLTLLLPASLPASPQAAGSSQTEGLISGTVLNEKGQPFQGVQVCTYMPYAPPNSKESRGDCLVTTDQAGHFDIDHVELGVIAVEAIKPEDGYIAFAGTSVKEVVTLSQEQRSATVILKLGPKAARLIPTVTDKLTGKPVTDYAVSWTIFDEDSTSSGGQSTSGGSRDALLPPEKYLMLSISAPGYRHWFYHDPSEPSRPAFVRFESGEEKELLVELEPTASGTQ